MFRTVAFTLLCARILAAAPLRAGPVDVNDWNAVEAEARGQTVYWYAWGGDPRINDYIAWVAKQSKSRYGVTLEHVKVDDTGSVVSRVLAEKAAGRDTDGNVDLVWINGENFAAMKRAGLLFSPSWADRLPNWSGVDVAGKPTVVTDFTIPTDGLEAPWGMAQLVFMADEARFDAFPRSMDALATWIRQNPGRFTYPQPPDFVGSTFLKQALYEVVDQPDILNRPAEGPQADRAVDALMTWLTDLRDDLWRSGKAFPRNYSALIGLLADDEIDIAFAFNPAAASNAIANGELPDSVRTFVFDGGTIGNSHFVAIPYNASSKAGALVLANFLLSPEAQAHKQDPSIWGDPTVLDVAGLPAEDRALFDRLDLGVATLSPADLGAVLPEPHPSWMMRVEEAWKKTHTQE
ncbi:MAG: ABC transporter substrate-binding protein [Pseudomonadota bacterium]